MLSVTNASCFSSEKGPALGARGLYIPADGCLLHSVRAQKLAADVEDALEGREDRQRGHNVDSRSQELEVAEARAFGEQQADRQDHDPHRARGHADLALNSERLGS